MSRHPLTGSNRTLAEVIPGRLWQSGRPIERQAVEAAGINVIVAVGEAPQTWLGRWMRDHEAWRAVSPERPQRRSCLHIPLIDAHRFLDPVAADVAIRAVVGFLRDPTRKVLVHCDQGAFRSVHVAASALAQTEGIDSATACKKVDAAREHGPYRDSALFAPDWKQHAESWPREADDA